MDSMVLALPNYLGALCTVALVPGCLLATGSLTEGSLLVTLANIWATLFYRVPCKLIPSWTAADIKEKESKKEK